MFYYTLRIVVVVVLILVAAILHQSVLNSREQAQPNVTEDVSVQESNL